MRNTIHLPDPDVLLRETEAADFLKLSARTLQAWRRTGKGPAYCTAGRAIRYRRCDLIDWIEVNIVGAPFSTQRDGDDG
ncbi:helix-turn-helix domain-containing protein [Microbaculum sp. FT89]|uniref:helix-turn-helix domain-containing protein n=1 Tax=Microbaculum sp. FT89 TaxID=3447298 RepID=UPI003F53461E